MERRPTKRAAFVCWSPEKRKAGFRICPKERSSGSTTRRATALSPRTRVARTSSCTTPGYPAVGSGRLKRVPRSPTRRRRARRGCRRRTSPPPSDRTAQAIVRGPGRTLPALTFCPRMPLTAPQALPERGAGVSVHPGQGETVLPGELDGIGVLWRHDEVLAIDAPDLYLAPP